MKRYFAVFVQFVFFSMLGFGAEFIDKHYFIENKGQLTHYDGTSSNEVLLYGHSNGVDYYLRKDGISYVFEKEIDLELGRDGATDTVNVKGLASHRIDINWVGSNQNALVKTEGRAKTRFNYHLAHCPKGIHDVHAYKKVVYKEFYPGIDLVFYITEAGMKYDFVVHPGGDPSQIEMLVDGADYFLTESGALRIESPLGELIEEAPISFQVAKDGEKQPIQSEFMIEGNHIKYSIANFNSDSELIIDPNRKWCLFFGSSGGDSPTAIEADSDGFSYVAGATNGTNFPSVTGAFQDTLNGVNIDVYLCKIDSSGKSMVWATYFGGMGSDYSEKLLLHADTMLYLSAVPGYSDYPAFGKVHTTSKDPGRSIALTRFDTSGHAYWSTFLGGGILFSGFDYDVLKAIRTDKAGHLYVYGHTDAPNFPTTKGAYQEGIKKASGYHQNDCFLSKFDLQGQLIWSTYMGSTRHDEATNMITFNGNRIVVSAEFQGYHPELAPNNSIWGIQVVAQFDTAGQIVDGHVFDHDIYLADNQDHFYLAGVFDRDTVLPKAVLAKRKENYMAALIELDADWNMIREIKVEESYHNFSFVIREMHFDNDEIYFFGRMNPLYAPFTKGAFAYMGPKNGADSSVSLSNAYPILGKINQKDSLVYLSSTAMYDTDDYWHLEDDAAFNARNDIFLIKSENDTLYATYEHGGITHRVGTIANANAVVVKFQEQDFDVGVRRQKPLCHGDANAQLKVEYDNNTSPLKIKWSTGDTTWLIDSLIPGWYSFTVSNRHGQFHSERVYIDSTELFQIEGEYDSLFCVERKGWLNIRLKSGIKLPVHQYRPYRYVYKGDTIAYAGGRYAMQPDFGNSTFYVLDIDGCKDSVVLEIDTFPVPKHSYSLKEVSCNKEVDGEIELMVADTLLFDGIFLDYLSGSSFISYGKDLAYTKMLPRTYRYIIKYGGSLRCETGDTFKLEYRSDTLFGLNVSPVLEVCNGDTVLLHVSNDIPRLEWSNGATSDTLYITKSDTLYAFGSTKNGCQFRSDTVITKVHPSDFGLAFTADPTELNSHPFTVDFENETPNQNRYSFTWEFGDGATSSDISPQHTYLNVGKYSVGLYAVDDTTGCSDSLVKKNLLKFTLKDGLPEFANNQPIMFMENEQLVVDINGWAQSEVELTLFDISGRKILNINTSLPKIFLDLYRYSSTVFVVELKNENLVYRERILK